MLLLDFIRYHEHLKGTKIGCREGDCGACTILVGEMHGGPVKYSTATSCLMAIGNAEGKHIVTIEGINGSGLNIVQQSFADEGATQCGFCTPGFVVSLTGYCMSEKTPSYDKAVDAVNGNICRCTGYKSIERAIQKIHTFTQQHISDKPLQASIAHNIIPEYFNGISERLKELSLQQKFESGGKKFLGGGTDLYVQQHDTMPYENVNFISNRKDLHYITQHGTICKMGGVTTVTEIANSSVFRDHFPDLDKYIRLISSSPIRNMATVGGNFINASPIGDLTIFFLALNAKLFLSNGSGRSEIMLRDFYKGYKKMDKAENEYIEEIQFQLPEKTSYFNFEKVSKRTHLDIATVNSAIHLIMDHGTIKEAGLSAGGVGPVPMYLQQSSSYMTGKLLSASMIKEVIKIALNEISPLSDARGTAEYKSLLLTQLITAHFITLFPEMDLHPLIQRT